MDLQEFVLLPETDARRALSDCRITLRVLAPVGHYAGRGKLRVLRARPALRHAQDDIAGAQGDMAGAQDDMAGAQDDKPWVELVCGYEAYDPFEKLGTPLRQAQDSGIRG